MLQIVLFVSLSYTSDEFEAGLVIGLGGQTWILSITEVGGGVWRSKCRLEEIGDFGKSTKCCGIWVLDKSLFRQDRIRNKSFLFIYFE